MSNESRRHVGKLIDRHTHIRPTLRVQRPSGNIIDVYVDAADVAAAAALYGNDHVVFTFRGGRPFFAPRGE